VTPRGAGTYMALAAPGWACARENMGESRTRSTETSDQGLRPRMIDYFHKPASRATRWALFALRRIEGTRHMKAFKARASDNFIDKCAVGGVKITRSQG
jgi:hypothetical protein